MRKIVCSVLVLVAITGIVTITGCEDNTTHYPVISFRIRADSVTKEDTYYNLSRDSNFSLLVDAAKTGPEGFLKSFKATRSINGGADSVLIDADLNTVSFVQRYYYVSGDSGNIEQYTFTITDANGLDASIRFIDTVR